ncbi:UDP-N-acetylmuramoyl-tripeptide--D-alanyl-D-alanine ligase [Bacillus sp. 7586-K]|nr:UDP-N-acetylmuramoyl-tripeptide--D-alanyl-D-alanine ligase [Bacillus sp. 7586-K]
MIRRTLSHIEKVVHGWGLAEKDYNLEIFGVTTDSRAVIKGNLFFPLVGEKFNGHEFVASALENGASAIVWQESEGNPPKDVPVIFVKDTLRALQQLAEAYLNEVRPKIVGITGSNGKTTTKDMVAALLETTYKVHKTKGNFNNHIGLPLTVLNMEEETEIAILEMGMSGKGEIELLSNIAKPDVAIITNIGESHLMDLGSREGIADAKLEIVKGLKEDGVLIYHGDEPLLEERVQALLIKTITFGEHSQNDFVATNMKQAINGTSFQVNNVEYTIPVLGKHNVLNALAAYAVAKHFKVQEDAMIQGFSQLKVTGMRLELIETEQGVSVINDAYNASPSSMKAAINLLVDLDGFNQKIVVLGDMLELGEAEKEYHYQIGASIDSSKIDYVITYGSLGKEIARGAAEKFSPDVIHHFDDKNELIKQLKSYLQPKDIVLVKASRGMRLEEVVNAITN